MNGPLTQPALLLSSLLTHAERHHCGQQVVSRRAEGDLHRCTYRELAERSRRLAHALSLLGVGFGERVATLAWTGYRHLELYLAASGSGAVLHALDPRQHPDQVAHSTDHANDKILFFDLSFLPLVEAVAMKVETIRAFVLMADRTQMPASTLVPRLLCYEDLLQAAPATFEWPAFDEHAAASVCDIPVLAGAPRQAVRSHRATLLHAATAALPDALNCSARDALLAAQPMSQVDAWNQVAMACLVGAKVVFPGPFLDGRSLHELIEGEAVSMAVGEPQAWQGLLAHAESHNLALPTLRRALVDRSSSLSAPMRALRERYGLQVLHAGGYAACTPTDPTSSDSPPNDQPARLTDHIRDFIKSDGEWIASTDVENIALSHPAVAMAACIAVAHPEWHERPLLVVVKKPGAALTREELLHFFAGRIARWWVPDDVAFVPALPLDASGKVLRSKLRERFQPPPRPAT